MTNDMERRMDDIERRLVKLEQVFSVPAKVEPVRQSRNYQGLTGGINFLTDNQFFNQLRTSSEVHAELMREGYYHSVQSVDKALRIDFVSKKKLLTRIKEDNVWKYGMRK
jgi:hypothetical protein